MTTTTSTLGSGRVPYDFTRSRTLHERAQRVIPGGSQITRLPRFDDYPIYFERAKGCRAWDVDGNEFIDFLCSIGPVILGYAYDRVDNAVRAVLERSFQSSMNSPHQIELAELLAAVIPSCDKSRFFKTGSEATHAAVRLARSITKRDQVARCGYHGWFDMWREPRMAGIHSGTCAAVIAWDQTVEALERTLQSAPNTFAAVIVCPTAVRPFARETFQAIIETAHRHGALAIFDEVKTGFRSALGGVQELMGVRPDITVLSKGIANGYPLAVVCGRDAIMSAIVSNQTTGTFCVEALSIVAAIETIRELRERDVPEHLRTMGQRLIDGLNDIAQRLGVEAHAYPDPVPAMPMFRFTHPDADTARQAHNTFYSEVIRRGVFLCDWHTNFVSFSHRAEDIDETLQVCEDVMKRMTRGADSTRR